MTSVQRPGVPRGAGSATTRGRRHLRRIVPLVAFVAAVAGAASLGVVAPASTPAGASAVPSLVCHGSLAGQPLNKPIVGIANTPDQQGYWLVASDGGVFSFGDAGFYGSAGNLTLNKPVVGIASTTDGKGYWLVASDGGVFSYGDAGFYGSAGNIRLNEPAIGISRTADGAGYWLAAADAGVFSYGDARYLGGGPISQDGGPIVTDFSSFAVADDFAGYTMASADGAYLLNFGTAKYQGLASPGTATVAGVTSPAAAAGYGYWEATSSGAVYTLTSSGQAAC